MHADSSAAVSGRWADYGRLAEDFAGRESGGWVRLRWARDLYRS